MMAHTSVLHRFSSGDADAEREFVERFGGLIRSLARQFSANEADAEDAMQEIMLNLWQSGSRFDPSLGSETTYVAMIARRRLMDRDRTRQRRSRGSTEDAGHLADPRVDTAWKVTHDHDTAMRAAGELPHLSPQQQRVLELSIRGLSHVQISGMTGWPLGTVKTHIRRGLHRLRWMLEERPTAGRIERAGQARVARAARRTAVAKLSAGVRSEQR